MIIKSGFRPFQIAVPRCLLVFGASRQASMSVSRETRCYARVRDCWDSPPLRHVSVLGVSRKTTIRFLHGDPVQGTFRRSGILCVRVISSICFALSNHRVAQRRHFPRSSPIREPVRIFRHRPVVLIVLRRDFNVHQRHVADPPSLPHFDDPLSRDAEMKDFFLFSLTGSLRSFYVIEGC